MWIPIVQPRVLVPSENEMSWWSEFGKVIIVDYWLSKVLLVVVDPVSHIQYKSRSTETPNRCRYHVHQNGNEVSNCWWLSCKSQGAQNRHRIYQQFSLGLITFHSQTYILLVGKWVEVSHFEGVSKTVRGRRKVKTRTRCFESTLLTLRDRGHDHELG